MTKKIEMLQSYPFMGTVLNGGATYEVDQMVGGFKLDEERVKRLIEEGWSKEVA